MCWPAEALSALQAAGLVSEGAACPAEPAVPRPGWPPLGGDCTVLRYAAPVAVCTLGDSGLAAAVAAQAGPQVAITGTLTTENLGIERLVAISSESGSTYRCALYPPDRRLRADCSGS